MIIVDILKNNEIAKHYIKIISTNITDNDKKYFIDYHVIFYPQKGKIYLFIDTSLWSNFYQQFNKSNNLYLQYVSELSLKICDSVEINEYTVNDSYFILKDGMLKFISNCIETPSWQLKITTNNLCVGNVDTQFPMFNFIYDEKNANKNTNANLLNNKHKMNDQKLNESYIEYKIRHDSNTFSYLHLQYKYELQYKLAYIYDIKLAILLKVSKQKDKK